VSTSIGEGEYRYRVEQDWAELPDGLILGDVAGVGVDSAGRVYAFHRGTQPVLVFEPDGRFVTSWGDGVFPHAHGVHITPDDEIFLTDDGDHTVRKCTTDGEVLLELGTPGHSSGFMSCLPFNRCTHTALAPNGDIWVSDGYQNAAVHRYSPDGTLLRTFGRPGVGPGEFNLPHALAVDAEGVLYVADRENHRIQLFDDDGRYLTEWRNVHRPSTIVPLPGPDPRWLVGEIGPVMRFNRGAPNLGPRLSILDAKGTVLTRLGGTPSAGLAPGQFLSPHGITVDPRGDIYIAQVSVTSFPQLFPNEPVPQRLPSLQKFIRED
jgi:DNA-binding beta-propeller fold protein YncE